MSPSAGIAVGAVLPLEVRLEDKVWQGMDLSITFFDVDSVWSWGFILRVADGICKIV